MKTEHPITPPPELVQQWCKQRACINEPGPIHLWLATEAARWGADQQLQLDAEQVNQAWQKGADQELEACCQYISRWFATPEYRAAELRAARRPKSPSLKEKALKALEDDPKEGAMIMIDMDQLNTIRRALEALPDV
jgi:hypothetical protein